MQTSKVPVLHIEHDELVSVFLDRPVKVDFYWPSGTDHHTPFSLLLINDGQDMETMGFKDILADLYREDAIMPLLCVAVHAGKDRKMEYGTARQSDYMGRGALAEKYTQFIFEELLPYTRKKFGIASFLDKSFAGFSLGGLMAMDIAINHPQEFTRVGIFSGSLWWRSKSLVEDYNDDTDRIMHAQVRQYAYYPWQRFYFTTGSQDETTDRNNNGIIDSIDDTLALIAELEKLGYENGRDICYINFEDGKHDVPTWGRAMPAFLKWGWGISNETTD